MTHQHFCPHCASLLAQTERTSHPPVAARCAVCRLVVGADRCHQSAGGSGGLLLSGNAAGVMVNAARRADCVPGDSEQVLSDLSVVAEIENVNVARLRMLDYDAAQRIGIVKTELATVLATYPTWKSARAAAAAAEALEPVLEIDARAGV